MIPQQLTLQNFLSYRQATLNFAGLHTACICGQNGAGKSSLLEAITWVIWGETRVDSAVDVIHIGENDTRVDFEFHYNNQTYKVIRTRTRSNNTTLNFQIKSNELFKSISQKNVKETQIKIIEILKLDYKTFINCAYLRQGKADEFMGSTSGERKKILVDLLDLNHYDDLAKKAGDLSKNFKAKNEELEQDIDNLQKKLAEKNFTENELNQLNQNLKDLQINQKKEQKSLYKLQEKFNQTKHKQESLILLENRLEILTKESEQITIEIKEIEEEINLLNVLLEAEKNINFNYQELKRLREEEINLRIKFDDYQKILKIKQNLEQKLQLESNDLSLTIEREKTNLINLEKQQNDLLSIINNKDKIDANFQQFTYYQEQLTNLDLIKENFYPLSQRRLNLEAEINKEKSTLNVKLEHLKTQIIELEKDLKKIPEIEEELLTLTEKIEELIIKENYLKRIEEKGLDKKSLIEKCEHNKQTIHQEIAKLEQKLILLSEDQAICPLCNQDLNHYDLESVMTKTSQEKKNFEDELWQLETQKKEYEKQKEELGKEYINLKKEISIKESLQVTKAKLEEKLINFKEKILILEQLIENKDSLENQLESGDYATNLKEELDLINAQITNLNYDEKTHSLVREEHRRLSKVNYEKIELDKAEKKYNQFQLDIPQELAIINKLENQLQELTKNSVLQIEIDEKKVILNNLNYDDQEYEKLKFDLEEKLIYESKYADLQQAKKQFPILENKLIETNNKFLLLTQEKTKIISDLEIIKSELQDNNYEEELKNQEQKCEEIQEIINKLLTKKGGLEQSLIEFNNRESEYKDKLNRFQASKKNYLIYDELHKAFGKNGIQTLIIENVLPQIEAEANKILSRLSGNQFHIQFLTRKLKSNASKKSENNLKDTLDINICDAGGTRGYETYSGGEAFRINFSIRLALAKILAQRSGTALQLLIVDEGFGTQDAEGCDLLIAAINAIADDFACILTVTHMPQFKEAFQTKIEVSKTNEGSKIQIVC